MKGLRKISCYPAAGGHANTVASGQVSFVQIDEGAAGQRIDNFLLRVCKGVPKSHVYRILRSGEVRVNKGRVGAQYRLAHGDVVRVPPVRVAQTAARMETQTAARMGTQTATRMGMQTAPDNTRAAPVVVPVATPATHFTILYEDDALLVIDKPAGVAVHGGSGIAFGVIEQMREQMRRGQMRYEQMRREQMQREPMRREQMRATPVPARFLELVHRLDRETSGVLMLAKKRSALVGLHAQIRENQIDKRYLACVRGDWQPDWGRRRAVREPLLRYLTPEGERRVRVQPDGLPSHTVFNLIERWPGYALVEAELKTGRTHQIRVHLAHLALPIAGDAKYGDFALNKALARAGARPALKRMFLHAHRLKITHPLTGEPLQFDAPLPPECQRFLDELNGLDGTPAQRT